jgi:hypothetical protein
MRGPGNAICRKAKDKIQQLSKGRLHCSRIDSGPEK